MSTPQQTDSPQELTPEARAVLARARRSFMVSMGILVVGLIAVGVAVVYRASQSSDRGGSEYSLAMLRIPQGGEVVSAVAADGRLSVTYRLGTATSVRIFDGKTGDMIREIPVVGE